MSARDDLAALLNGREYGEEISKVEEAAAKVAAICGLLIIFGASDDLIEFRGAFHDECGAYGGTSLLVCQGGVVLAWEDFDEKDDEEMARAYFEDKKHAFPVTADWDKDGYSWIITSPIPHATFEIIEDGEKYCRGIVIDMADLRSMAWSAPA